MRNIVLIKLSTSVEGRHVVVPSRIVQNHPNGIDGVSVQIKSCQQYTENLLRVAASSNNRFRSRFASLSRSNLIR